MMRKRRCILLCFVLFCLVLSSTLLYSGYPSQLILFTFFFYHSSPSLITSFFHLNFAYPFSHSLFTFSLPTFSFIRFICFIVLSSSFKMNPMTEKKEESDPDTTRLCEMRIQKITALGGIPVLAK